MVNKVFQATELELIARAEYIAETVNDFQTIKQYMNNRFDDNMKLTQSQEHQLKMYQYVYDQSQTHKYTEFQIRNQLKSNFGLNDRQAWDVFKKAQELFATALHINKLFQMRMDILWIEKLQRKAEAANDMDAFAKLQKVKNDIRSMIPDTDEVAGDDFKPIQVEFQFNPEILGRPVIPKKKIKELVDQLVKDYEITGFANDFFDDAEIISEEESNG